MVIFHSYVKLPEGNEWEKLVFCFLTYLTPDHSYWVWLEIVDMNRHDGLWQFVGK